jgi:hypothetical protein
MSDSPESAPSESDSPDSSSYPAGPRRSAPRTPTRPFVAPNPGRAGEPPLVATPPGRPVLRPFSPPVVRRTVDAPNDERVPPLPHFGSGAGASTQPAGVNDTRHPRAGDQAESPPYPGPDLGVQAEAAGTGSGSLGPSHSPIGQTLGWGFGFDGSPSRAGATPLPPAPGDRRIGGATSGDPEGLEQLKEMEPWVPGAPAGSLPDVVDLAEAVAAALDRVARRVRAGEVVVESSRTPATDEEALALALLALLTPPR